MRQEDIAKSGATIRITELRAYRAADGRRTRGISAKLELAELTQKAVPIRVLQVMEEGAVAGAARGMAGYWSRRNDARLLRLPATRRNLVPLNEALRLTRKRR